MGRSLSDKGITFSHSPSLLSFLTYTFYRDLEMERWLRPCEQCSQTWHCLLRCPSLKQWPQRRRKRQLGWWQSQNHQKLDLVQQKQQQCRGWKSVRRLELIRLRLECVTVFSIAGGGPRYSFFLLGQSQGLFSCHTPLPHTHSLSVICF